MSEPQAQDSIWDRFADPETRAQGAFWFWNAELDPATIRRQLQDMREKGIGSVCIHARTWLPETVGYLTERWFEMVGVAIEEAAATGITVWIYDEAMYPSGSASGLVTADSPDLRCKGLVCETFRIEGECPRCNFAVGVGPDEKLVAVIAARLTDGLLEPESFQDLTEQVSHGSLEWDCGAGLWQVMVLRQRFQNSVIRGLGYGPVPYAPDLLNPSATDRFIALTHEQYYARFGRFFGSTVAGFFTDEPNPTGRGGIVGALPWTDTFLAEFGARMGYDLKPWLPALFYETADRSENVRWDYEEVLADLVDSCFYGRLSDWCRRHGVQLTGHPAGFGELKHLSTFDVPGQDVVWRQVTPENPRPVMGKIASSAAHIYGKPNAAAEVYGAYGWHLSPSEMKWLADWLLVRGVDTHIVHAAYYSLEGENRFDRPPDVCMGSPWWRHFRLFSDYVSRLAAVVRCGRHVADIAIFDQCNHTDDRVPFMLLQLQRDYDFLESRVLTESARIGGGRIRVHDEEYRVLVLPDIERISVKAMRSIAEFAAEGGKVLAVGARPSHAAEYGRSAEVRALAERVWNEKNPNARVVRPSRESLSGVLDGWLRPDIRVSPPCPHLRYLHRRAGTDDIYLLVNESVTESVDAHVTFADGRVPEIWHTETATSCAADRLVQEPVATSVPIYLAPYQSVIVAFSSAGPARPSAFRDFGLVTDAREIVVHGSPAGGTVAELRREAPARAASRPSGPLPATLNISSGWTLREYGSELRRLVSWTELPKLRYYSGTCRYVREVYLPEEYCDENLELVLGLGDVRETAELCINGEPAGVRLWPPYDFDATGRLRAGRNLLEVLVTNTPANEYDRNDVSSGLLGPVALKPHWSSRTPISGAESVATTRKDAT